MANPENKQIPYESTQKDIRDAIESVATAIGGIAIPSADHVSYDNSGSGLSATDVQNAIDELSSEKVDKEVGKGLSTNDYTDAEKTKLAGIEAGAEVNPTSSAKTATESFETVDGGLLSKCVIDLVPVQSGSGDPSPDNIRPISGHTEVKLQRDGKNRFDEVYTSIRLSLTYKAIYVGDGTFTMSTNTPLNEYSNANLFFLQGDVQDGASTLYNGVSNGVSRTISSVGGYVTVGYRNNDGVDPRDYHTQIEKGNQATPYEPYLGHLYQVQIGSTVYGGYVDLVSGVMTVDRKSLDLGSQSWVIASTNTTGKYRMFTTLSSDYAKAVGSEQISNAVCDIFKTISAGQTYRLNDGVSVNGSQIIIYDERYDTSSSASDFTTAMNGHQLVYELATPFIIQLTPQQIEALVGQNNLSTPLSGQSIETNGVEYKELFTFADVKEYVDKKIPDAPTTDGTYTLTATVSSGVATYSWT